MTSRPDHVFDLSLQHERTALAWERTAVALMLAGGLLLNYAEDASVAWAQILGLTGLAAGAAIFLWSARRYETLHGALRAGTNITHPSMLKTVALVSTTLTAGAIALVLAAITS
jgi:uncharacterized membrane protein YidH (DUF202 family)